MMKKEDIDHLIDVRNDLLKYFGERFVDVKSPSIQHSSREIVSQNGSLYFEVYKERVIQIILNKEKNENNITFYISDFYINGEELPFLVIDFYNNRLDNSKSLKIRNIWFSDLKVRDAESALIEMGVFES